jgi:hypothetical protein
MHDDVGHRPEVPHGDGREARTLPAIWGSVALWQASGSGDLQLPEG